MGKVPVKFKKAVVDSFRRHAWNMGISHYHADILYMKDDKSSGNNHTLADIDVNRRYLTCQLRVFPALIERWKKSGMGELEDVIAHETAHILTQHLYDCGAARYQDPSEMIDAWEALTEAISRISIKLDKGLR